MDGYAARSGIRIPSRGGTLVKHRGMRLGAHSVKPPRILSFIDNPKETLKFFHKFVGLLKAGTEGFFIDQTEQRDIDISAGLLLNVIAYSARHHLGVRFGGRYPREWRALEIVVAAGLPPLFVRDHVALSTVKVFKVRHGHQLNEGGQQSTPKERVADAFVRYVKESFTEAGCDLALADQNALHKIITEVLGNAEDHGDGVWWLAGHMRKPQPEQPFAEWELSLLNFGASISDTLRQMPDGPERDSVEQLVSEHRRQGIFNSAWTEDGLWTFYALQEGISSNVKGQGTVAGMGLTDLLEAFTRLGATNAPGFHPRLCLLSGTTHIVFDENHAVTRDRNDRRIIALNSSRSLSDPPDAGTVSSLWPPFPGTLVGIRFFLDPRNGHGSR